MPVGGIRREGGSRIGLVSAEAHPPYNRPPLSKGLWKGKPLESIWRQTESQGVILHLRRTAQHLDPQNRRVTDDQGTVYGYDKLLLATGGAPRRLPFGSGQIIYFRSLDDYECLRALTAKGQRFAVIGGGFIGSEVAASLRQKGLNVVAIDPSKTPLFRVLGEAVGQTIADLHRAHGVRTIFGDTVAAFEGAGRVNYVVTKAGLRLECDFVVVGIGIEPALDMLEGSGIVVDNGVVVDEYCETNVSGIYAAGDIANHYHPVFNRRIRVEHWQNAIKQGAAAARNMLGKRIVYDEIH